MVSRKDQNNLLLLGGAAVAGYLLLSATGQAAKDVGGAISAPFVAIPQAIQAGLADLATGVGAGAAGLGAGAVNVVGAAGTGLVGGVTGAVWEGIQDLSRPTLPLRTYKPVPEVRHIPLEEQIGWTEQPVITVEEYEARQRPATIPYRPSPMQPEPLPSVEQLQTMQFRAVLPAQEAKPSGSFWINPVTQETIAPFVPGQTPAGVSSLRQQDIFPSVRSV